MKVTQLMYDCKELIRKGYGDCEIYISENDEGSSFHKLHYSFTTNEDDDLSGYSFWGADAPDTSKIVLLW